MSELVKNFNTNYEAICTFKRMIDDSLNFVDRAWNDSQKNSLLNSLRQSSAQLSELMDIFKQMVDECVLKGM